MAVNAAKEQKDVVRQRWQAPLFSVRSSAKMSSSTLLQDYVESLNQRAPPEAGLALIHSIHWAEGRRAVHLLPLVHRTVWKDKP